MKFSTLQNYAKILLCPHVLFSKQSSHRCSFRSASYPREHTCGPIHHGFAQKSCVVSPPGSGLGVGLSLRQGLGTLPGFV